ncbi:MAG: hypothetical protein R6U96_07860 [Promethearchaeia archaeon]
MSFSEKFFKEYSKKEAERFFRDSLKNIGPVTGYHGYWEERFNDYESKKFHLSTHNGNWLGTGLYFFQDAPLYARGWAKFITRKKLTTEKNRIRFRVMKANINLINCLCFCGKPAQSLFLRIREIYDHYLEKMNWTIENQEAYHYLDNSIVETICHLAYDLGFEVKSVRGAFPAGKDIFYSGVLKDMTHIQFTLRKNYYNLIQEMEIIDEDFVSL